jgi:hypothetical protein
LPRVYLEWQIAAGHLDRLPALAAALAETAGDDLDQFYYSRDRLAYHGHLALLAETMARAWPLVRESDKYLPGVDEEFASEAQLPGSEQRRRRVVRLALA